MDQHNTNTVQLFDLNLCPLINTNSMAQQKSNVTAGNCSEATIQISVAHVVTLLQQLSLVLSHQIGLDDDSPFLISTTGTTVLPNVTPLPPPPSPTTATPVAPQATTAPVRLEAPLSFNVSRVEDIQHNCNCQTCHVHNAVDGAIAHALAAAAADAAAADDAAAAADAAAVGHPAPLLSPLPAPTASALLTNQDVWYMVLVGHCVGMFFSWAKAQQPTVLGVQGFACNKSTGRNEAERDFLLAATAGSVKVII
ncbi:hypothetical protein DXG01_006687 [Tephrocybe rancida]|nr:hypothetical protein DXG01_006687 [Tephrocybe rancida]